MDKRPVLVALDLSECSQQVVERAAELAAPASHPLVLVYVVELPVGVAPDTELAVEGQEAKGSAAGLLEAEARARLAPLVAQLAQRGFEAQARIVHGRVADALSDAADALDAHMIVMGSHGRSGVARLLFGSIAEEMLTRASCPVTVVRTQHGSSCEASSCGWCASDISPRWRQIAVETDG